MGFLAVPSISTYYTKINPTILTCPKRQSNTFHPVGTFGLKTNQTGHGGSLAICICDCLFLNDFVKQSVKPWNDRNPGRLLKINRTKQNCCCDSYGRRPTKTVQYARRPTDGDTWAEPPPVKSDAAVNWRRRRTNKSNHKSPGKLHITSSLRVDVWPSLETM